MGTLLARALQRKGAIVAVAERSPRRCSTLIYAGMIDPISGQRFAVSWRYAETIEFALTTYAKLETELGCSLITPRKIWRLFRDTADRTAFEKKMAQPVLPPYIDSVFETSPLPVVDTPFGGALVKGGYQIDVGTLIQQTATHLPMIWNPDPTDIHISKEGASFQGRPLRGIITCTGAFASVSPHFSWLPFRNSRGETLTLETPDLHLDAIINNGHWLLPQGPTTYRYGATYDWENLFSSPAAAAYSSLLDRLTITFPRTKFTPTAVEVGTRSILCDTRPVIGKHPQLNGLWIAGGVGSKGTQIIPDMAEQLANHLVAKNPINPEISIDRFLNLYL